MSSKKDELLSYLGFWSWALFLSNLALDFSKSNSLEASSGSVLPTGSGLVSFLVAEGAGLVLEAGVGEGAVLGVLSVSAPAREAVGAACCGATPPGPAGGCEGASVGPAWAP